jgi:FixJ family two-component response regulator
MAQQRSFPRIAVPTVFVELEVLRGVVGGLLGKQIADELGITERTVKAHRHSIMAKLGVVSVAELVRLADRIAISHAPAAPHGA